MYTVFVEEYLEIPHESSWTWDKLSGGHVTYVEYRCHESFPLVKRAWAFQERLLSPRVVHFGLAEIFFECKECYSCECRRVYIPEVSYTMKGIEKKEYKAWETICEEYSRMALTFPEKDTLPALAGLARRFASPSRGRYVAGVWEGEIFSNLMWYESSPDDEEPKPISQDRRIPSWSWASNRRNISFRNPIQKCLAVLHGIDFALAGPDPYGEIEYAYIDIDTDVFDAFLTHSKSQYDLPVGHSTQISEWLITFPWEPTSWTEIHMDTWWQDRQERRFPSKVLLLLIGVPECGPNSVNLLILKQDELDTAMYYRIGWMYTFLGIIDENKLKRRLRLRLG
jgi:hypothetical protein